MLTVLFIALFGLSQPDFCIGQDSPESPEFYDPNFLRYSDFIYEEGIKTVQLYPEGKPFDEAVIRFQTSDKLVFSFDDLKADSDPGDYSYRFIHCGWDWKPSRLETFDVLEGFPGNRIRDYSASVNTLVPYIHYSLVFPNEDIRFLVSGNYLLVVYRGDDPEKTVITRRFMVLEPLSAISAQIRQATLSDQRKNSQEIDLSVKMGVTPADPYAEIRVVIRQNRRWDNANSSLKPVMVKGNELIYDYFDENIFPGGSEFRYFNTKSHKVPGDRIAGIRFEDGLFQFELVPDEVRRFKLYAYNRDINGRYKIDVEDGQNPDLEADYVKVLFFVPVKEAVEGGNLYLAGDFSLWNLLPANRLSYDERRKGYAASLLLKQGYYDYQYLFVADSEGKGDPGIIEGNHYETENDYQFLVYYLPKNERYHRLIGYTVANSRGRDRP